MNDNFGANAVALPNGNVVVPEPNDDFVASSSGAVYFFNSSTGALISTLIGQSNDDRVGSGGVTVLTNGNFVVVSQHWSGPGCLLTIKGV